MLNLNAECAESEINDQICKGLADQEALSQLTTSRPPSPSVLIRFLLMMRSELNRMKNEVHFFPYFFIFQVMKNLSKIGVMTGQK